jgi:AraC-like DNA-binding protein
MTALSTGSFEAWIHRCQRHTGGTADDPARVSASLVRLVADLPRGLDVDEQMLARRLLDAAWRRLTDLVLPLNDGSNIQPAADWRVSRALAEIDRQFTNPAFHLRTLARQLAISDSRLTYLLKQTTGQTFGGRLHARRIDEARALLAGSSLSVKEIASRVGYATTSQLDRQFRKHLKCLPTAFRSEVWRDRGTRSAPTQSRTQRQK